MSIFHNDEIEKLKESNIVKNPFAVFPESALEKALEVIEEFSDEIKPL
jgi:hypothetical protein